MKHIRIKNPHTMAEIATQGRVADTYWSRLVGLMGSAPLLEGECLLLSPSSSIHTHFMRFAIDVLYLDSENHIVGLDENLKPWRIGSFYKGTEKVVELPAGTIATKKIAVGDKLSLLISD